MKKVATSRWLVIVAGIWIQCTSGSSYTFGIYSETIKSNLGYDQSTLDTISSFKDIGANIGVISGLLYGITSPWVVLLAGALQNCVGYAMMWLSITGRIAHPALWQMCLYMFLAAHAQTFFQHSCGGHECQELPHRQRHCHWPYEGIPWFKRCHIGTDLSYNL